VPWRHRVRDNIPGAGGRPGVLRALKHPFEKEPMSDQIPSPQQSAAFEEAIAYLDSLTPGELERRIAEQDSAAERWAR
jgi:hypothetical protein